MSEILKAVINWSLGDSSRLRRSLAWLAILLCACSATPAHARDDGTIPGERIVPLFVVEFSGHRYVASGDFGLGSPVPLMIHGNARMFLMLTHPVAEKIGGGPVAKLEDYGYSAKGKGIMDVSTMRLGGKRFSKLSRVPVFDFTEERDSLVQGMLGVAFLTAERAAVDFSKDQLILGVGTSEHPNARLLVRGYKYTRMKISANQRATIEAYFPALGRNVPITPSTVSTALTLHQPLFAGVIAMEKTAAPDRSPSRTSPDEFVSDGVEFALEGVEFRIPASFEDLAEYSATTEAELESYGMLGFDWMKEHDAILDYANRLLYFKP